MNLPSSLALPQSNLLRSRVGIVILVAAAALLGGVAYFVLRGPAPAKLPTAATSPAAQALPRGAAPAASVAAKPAVGTPVVYGPPAPEWVKRDLSVVAQAPSMGAASTVKTVGMGPTTATPAAPGTSPAATAATPAPAAPATASIAPPAAATTAAATAAGASTAASAAPGTATAVPGASVAAPSVPLAPGAGAVAASDEAPKVLDANTLFQREQYVYQAAGRRDPFQSLIDGKYESQSGDGALVDVGDIHLVGIMWGSSDKFALVEDSRGRGFVLRVGDPVVNGYIAGISKTELQVVQNAFGDSQTVTIQLKSKEGDPNATTPGYRVLEKAAVAAGGCGNHRFDLGSGILIKDNHIAACGGVTAAVARARAGAPHPLRIECEVTSLAQLDEALAAGAEVVLLDNMTPEQVAVAAARAHAHQPAALVEVSGGITLATLADYARAGADLISVGALTHSAPAVDIGLDFV